MAVSQPLTEIHDPIERPVVLVVDDERTVRKICTSHLSSLECEVVVAATGDEALGVLDRSRLDVVVTDYLMPGMTGVELLGRIREVSPDTVRVLYTGVIDTRIAEEALNRAEAFRFLVKPFTGAAFREAVGQALDYRRMVRENRLFREEMNRLVEAQGRDLAAANGVLESLLQALPAGVLAMDPECRIRRANPAAQQILGLSEGEFLGRFAADVGVPCRRDLCASEDIVGPRWSHREIDVIDHRGLRRALFWSCEGVGGANGARDGCVASFIDISDKKDLEIKVFQAKEEIEAVFDSITDPTFVADEGRTIVRANQAFARFVRRPFPEILGNTCSEVLNHQAAECPTCPMGNLFHTGQRADREYCDGKGTVHKVHYFPLFKAGRVESVVVRYQDVTAERELEHRLLQSEKMASIGQLAAGIAHEINNPVAFILSNLNRLDEYAGYLFDFSTQTTTLIQEVQEAALDPKAAWEVYAQRREAIGVEAMVKDVGDIIGECKDGAGRIRKIVADLKTFSHPDGKDWEYADLNRGIESTLNIVWNELKYTCQVVKDFGEIPQVLCRPQQLNQVFMNLLVNAAQAIPERGTITVRTRPSEETVEVVVSDTGVGIAPENLGRIFDPFFTTKPVGKGTGLGLHLALGIARSHGGEIRVESEVGKGTTFTVVLPLMPPQAREGAGEGSHGE